MKEIEDSITSRQLSVIDNLGRVPIIRMRIVPSKKTCKNYLALVANENDVSMCTSVISKTRTRYTNFSNVTAQINVSVAWL